ncbi:MAG: GSU2403 family nucleotidyltransferase fold protein [Rhodoglobus sp.]
MNPVGADPFMATDPTMVLIRATLLDALEALTSQLAAVVVIGAQAVYLHTGAAQVALAEFTKDSDLAIDPRILDDDPLIETAMEAARFYRPPNAQPGAWMSPRGVPVDLMVPEQLAGSGGAKSRSARIDPHSRRAARRAVGLEAAVVDARLTEITALEPGDPRTFTVRVAGPAALLVAKLHKIAERIETPHRRAEDKDAHDVYRLLQAVPTETISRSLQTLEKDPLSRAVTLQALVYLQSLFADSPTATGSMMAGRAEDGIGDPEQVAVAVSFLASDLLSGTQ